MTIVCTCSRLVAARRALDRLSCRGTIGGDGACVGLRAAVPGPLEWGGPAQWCE